jgi:hypothetical protein
MKYTTRANHKTAHLNNKQHQNGDTYGRNAARTERLDSLVLISSRW